MITDARRMIGAGAVEADICIIGAGAAGITLALELEHPGRRIVLLELGGIEYDAAAQRLLEGEVAGDRYPALRDTRLAALGGSTGVWAGLCRPLEASDFETRGERIGWPFPRTTLEPYYRRAHDVCGLAAFDYELRPQAPGTAQRLLLEDDAEIRNLVFHVHALHFGRQRRHRLAASRHIALILHAPATRLVSSESGDHVERVMASTRDGRGFEVRARQVVLAAGGIENARLLLMSGPRPELAPGNAHGLVGRYFTDHPFVEPGFLVLAEPGARVDSYFPTTVRIEGRKACVRRALSLAPAVIERERLQNGALFLYPRYETDEAFMNDDVKSFLEGMAKLRGKAVPGDAGRQLARALQAPREVTVAILRKLLVRNGPGRRWRLRGMFETESRYDNRVTLGSTLDALGRPRAHVEWRLSERDLASMRRFVQLANQAFRRAGKGVIELVFDDDPREWRKAALGGKHHMGTTRMHRDPAQGVVDADARVHGVDNLYVAGSSVFPTGGFANPTLTIVALALRLAEHIRRRL